MSNIFQWLLVSGNKLHITVLFHIWENISWTWHSCIQVFSCLESFVGFNTGIKQYLFSMVPSARKIAFQIWRLSGTLVKLPFYITAGRKCLTQIEMQNCGSGQIGVEFDVWPSCFSCHTHQPTAPFPSCLSTSVDILLFVVFPSTAQNLLSQYRSF